MHALSRSAFLVLFASVAACSSGSTPNPLGSGGSGSSSATTGGSTGSTGSGGGGAGGNDPNGSMPCPGKTTSKVPASAFCAKDAVSTPCDLVSDTRNQLICGVPLTAPSGDLARSSAVKEYGGTGAPQVGCFAPAGYPQKADPASSKSVKMSGVVKIFSHGCESKDVHIEVFEAAAGGALGPAAGTAVTTPASCMAAGAPVPDADCGTRYECSYSISGLPTEKELVVNLTGNLWVKTYAYGLFIPNAAVKGGSFAHDVVAVSADDLDVIVQAATGAPLASGSGVVLGEVHDCGDVRLMNAVVDIDHPRKVLNYFTSNEDHPLPDLSAMGTGAIGLYSAIEVSPGPIAVAASGKLPSGITTLGFQRATVFPDALTMVTFRGAQPYQVP